MLLLRSERVCRSQPTQRMRGSPKASFSAVSVRLRKGWKSSRRSGIGAFFRKDESGCYYQYREAVYNVRVQKEFTTSFGRNIPFVEGYRGAHKGLTKASSSEITEAEAAVP